MTALDANDIARKHGTDGLRKAFDEGVLEELPSEPARLSLVPFDNIVLGTERRYLVKGLIPIPGLSVIWGAPKSGKSFWTFDLVMHVALGWEYRGRRVHQGPVIYCCFEGQSGVRARVEAFRQRYSDKLTEEVPFFLQPVTLDLVRDHPELIEAVRAKLREAKPVAIVLDTLNRSLTGSESNMFALQMQFATHSTAASSSCTTAVTRITDREVTQALLAQSMPSLLLNATAPASSLSLLSS
jgi:hypothetical protein